jgi:DnaJ-class molecular chaperone
MNLQKSYDARTCAWCEGKGDRPMSAGRVVSCMVCGGKGHVSIRNPTEQCPQCNGTGKRNIISACLACGGAGWSRKRDQ